nr:RHS repeat-associated core domain-containing protein [Photorhabdus luminescens]
MDPKLYQKTPVVNVHDNRGLTIRNIDFHRTTANGDTDIRITRHQYDSLGHLSQSTDPRLYEAKQKPNFLWQYDLTGNILCTESVDAGRTVTLNDIEGRPLLTVTATGVIQTRQYETSSLPGRLLSVTEQIPEKTSRITERLIWAGNSEAEKNHNLAGQCVRHYDTAGVARLESLSLTGTVLSQSSQLLSDTQEASWTGDNETVWQNRLADDIYTTLNTFDATGALLTQTDAKGNIQRLAYDVAGQLNGSWLTLKGQTEQVIIKSLSYSAAGQKLREEHENGIITEYSYEPETQRLIGIKTHRLSDAKVLQDLRYQYDPVGNVISIRNDAEATRFWHNQKVVPENTYNYDSLYQLISATGREMANIGQQSNQLPSLTLPSDNNTYTNYTRTYTYDRGGNLTKIQHSSPATQNNYTTNITVSNRSNRAVLSTLTEDPAQVDALFDAGGHQNTLIPGQNLNWNTRGELQNVTLVKRDKSANDDREWYRYSGDGRRILKVNEQQTSSNSQTQRITYLPSLELRLTQNSTTTTKDLQVITVGEAGRAQVRVLHWDSGQPEDIDNNQLRYSYDNLIGSSQLELDSKGEIISEEEYYPYGGTALWAARRKTEASYKTIRYSGKERDATGLYYYGYRYYQPWVGRWLSADPAGTVDGLNLYRMVRNNPVTLLDPDGRAPMASDDLDALKNNYNKENGDLFYGLAANRPRYIRGINPDFNSKDQNSTPMIIDTYNNNISKTVWSKHPGEDNDKINELFDDPKKYSKGVKVPANLQTDIAASESGWHPLWEDYFKAGEKNKKFNISKIYKKTSSKYDSDFYHSWALGEMTPKLLWKRGSKLGLEIAASNEKTKIHFVLDGLNIEQIVNKEKGPHPSIAGPGESVTASELRYAYRNRERLAGKIHFYENDKETIAPWEKSPELWEKYKPRSRNSGIISRLVTFIRNIPTLFRRRR